MGKSHEKCNAANSTANSEDDIDNFLSTLLVYFSEHKVMLVMSFLPSSDIKIEEREVSCFQMQCKQQKYQTCCINAVHGSKFISEASRISSRT